VEFIVSPFCEVMTKCFHLKARVRYFGMVVKEIRAFTELSELYYGRN
jgi:hypothetical protein